MRTKLLLTLLFAFLLRVMLAPIGFHVDIFSNAAWGEWIYKNGPLGFYENTIWIFSWPTQPPFVSLLYGFDRYLYEWLLELFRYIGNTIVHYRLAPSHMRWWFAFTIWFDQAKLSPESPFQLGYLIIIKLLPILSDLGIGYSIYTIATRAKRTIKESLGYALLYLFSPFSLYLSSIWGQYDQLAFLPLIIAFIGITWSRYLYFSPILFALSLAIKPTGLILLPLYVCLYWKRIHADATKQLFHFIIVPFIVIMIFFVTTTSLFTHDSLTTFLPSLYEKIFLKSEMRISTNAFNFWRIFIGNQSLSQNTPFFMIPGYIYSLVFFIALHLIVLKNNIIQKVTIQSVVTSLFIISAGSFLFMTNMLDRYFFTGIVTGLIICIYYPKLIRFWIIASMIFMLNLYNQWFFPEYTLLKDLLLFSDGFWTRVLSFIQVGTYIYMVRHILLQYSKNTLQDH